MKNKRLLYVLLPAVLMVWGLIFQRVWSATQDPNGRVGSEFPPTDTPTPPNAPRHRPALLLHYADPFKASKPTETLSRSTPTSASQASPGTFSRKTSLNLPIAPPPVAAIPVVWPQLKYLGSINNVRRNSGVAMMNIDGKEIMIKAGDDKGAVKIASLFRDSVQVVFHGQKKTVLRAD